MVTEQILSSIDNINNTADRSSFLVLESMCKVIEKEIVFNQYCSPEMITEGAVMDEVKKKSSTDKSKLKTILMFLPRLFEAIAKVIKDSFSDSSVGDALKNFSDSLEKEKDMAAKQKRIEEINAKNDGNFSLYVDEKDGKVKLKIGKKEGFGALIWLGTTAVTLGELLSGISEEKDLADPSKIRKFNDQCEKIIREKNDKKASEVMSMGIDALGDLAKHVTNGAGSIAALSLGAKKAVEIKLAKLEAEGEKTDGTVLSGLSDLLTKLTVINGTIAVAGATMKAIKKYTSFLPGFVAKHERNNEIIEATEATPGYDDMTFEQRKAVYDEKVKERNEQEQAEYNAKAEAYKAEKEELRKSPTIFSKKKNKNNNDSSNTNVNQETAEIEVDDDEDIVDEMTDEELLERHKQDPDVEIIDGKAYSKNYLSSLRGGPPTKKEEEVWDKVNKSVLSRPLGNKKALEHWKKHPEDRDIGAKYGTTSYHEQVEDEEDELKEE